MDMDTDLNAVNEEQLKVEEIDDSCRVDFTQIVTLTRDTDGSGACVIGDLVGEVKEVDLADLKQEPHDVCCVLLYPIFSLSQQSICIDHSLVTERFLSYLVITT